MKLERAKSFTAEARGILNVLMTPCGISLPFNPLVVKYQPVIKQFNAIWDTGATGTVITKDVVEALNLKPTGIIEVSGVHGKKTVNTYKLNLFLPNQVAFPYISASEGDLGGQAGVLIGMDIISKGDFAVTNFNGNTMFTFRVPSLGSIDFNKEQSVSQEPAEEITFKAGRNEPCPCGSGEKFKRCHGKK